MPIESPIDDLSSLNEAWPLDSEVQKFTDDHLRLVKDALRKQFTDLAANGGAVNASAAEMNYLTGLTGPIQPQLDATSSNWQFTTNATLSPTPGQKFLIDPPTGGTVVTLPAAPVLGSEVQIMDASGLAAPPNNTITVNRSGADAINNITTGQANLTSVQLDANGQHYYFVYYAPLNRWYAWAISGWAP